MNTLALIAMLSAGIAIFFAIQSKTSARRSGSEEKVMKGYFLLGLSGLMAKIAIADGRVSDDEAELAYRFFHEMTLSDTERAICIGNFVTARRDGLDARDHSKRFIAYANGAACRFLYILLWKIAMADGILDPKEDSLMQDVAKFLGLDGSIFEDLKAGKTLTCDKEQLRAAGVPESLVAVAD